MGKFNLIDEGWIPVMYKENGENKMLSLREIFADAGKIRSLSTDSPTQDFAVLRLLLAILHTVYSRYDFDSEVYPEIELDDQGRQKEEVRDSEDLKAYKNNLVKTWKDLWDNGEFTQALFDYLEDWQDRFFLFDGEYPFFQVKAEDIAEDRISKSKASAVSGKNMNRLISESNNKIALFSPKYESNNNKSILNADEIARWLITFQGYSGLSDKVIFGKEKYKSSKGWIFDLGGIYLEGDNLFETLLLNLVIINTEGENYNGKIQKPCWEFESQERLEDYLLYVEMKTNVSVDNLAELYTNWSRAIYIDPNTNVEDPFYFNIVKLPDLDHQNQFLEPMTLWKYNKDGDNKGTFTPRKHQIGQSLWRNFGLISLIEKDENTSRAPGIIRWLENLKKANFIEADYRVRVKAISMQDDGNATSWVPTNEIYDSLNIKEELLTDLGDDGAVIRIEKIVDETKQAVGNYRTFVNNIREIRNLESRKFVDDRVEEMYYLIDQPFKDWISSINSKDQIPEKIIAWRKELKDLILRQADQLLKKIGNRDYKGIEKNDRTMNIITSYNSFRYFLFKTLKIEGGKRNGK